METTFRGTSHLDHAIKWLNSATVLDRSGNRSVTRAAIQLAIDRVDREIGATTEQLASATESDGKPRIAQRKVKLEEWMDSTRKAMLEDYSRIDVEASRLYLVSLQRFYY